MNDRDHAEGARNDRDRAKVKMQKRDRTESGGMRNCAEEGEGWCRGTRNALRAQRMVLSGRGMAPSERGIGEREDMDISEDTRDSAEGHATPHHNMPSNHHGHSTTPSTTMPHQRHTTPREFMRRKTLIAF